MLKSVPEMGKAILEEIRMRGDYLGKQSVSTIYFGGGTPSLLPAVYISSILSLIRRSFFLTEYTEITLEANPDDLSYDKLKMFYDLGINRLSIGIQSFDNDVLKFINRAHSRQQALDCIEDARKIGFRNINIDLIHSIPGSRPDRWQRDLEIILDVFPEHISSYGLTIEPGTVFGKWQKEKRLIPLEEDMAASEYELLINHLQRAGYEHYEISNFALPGHRSKHNMSYWMGDHYMGIGPGAHSYNGTSRQYNITNNARYIKAIHNKELPATLETLTKVDQANEYLLTSLRTSWGIDLKVLREKFDLNLLNEQETYLKRLIEGGLLMQQNDHLILTDKGKLLADQITEDLFLTSP